jgi:hypothetical protein
MRFVVHYKSFVIQSLYSLTELSPCLQFTVTCHPCKTITLPLVHCHISSIQNRRIISTSLPGIIYVKLSHNLQFIVTYYLCKTVALSPFHYHVSYRQNCHIVTNSLPGTIYAKLAHCLQFTATDHTCKIVTLRPVHCHVSSMQNFHIISSLPYRLITCSISTIFCCHMGFDAIRTNI